MRFGGHHADKHLIRRLALGVVAFLLCLTAGAVFVITESAVLKSVSASVIVGYFVFLAGVDWLEARLNEKHVEANPHLLKNDAIGEEVRASRDFEAQSDMATGTVFFRGERWKACCSGGHIPKAGDILIVSGREGLTLVVRDTSRQGSGIR